MKQTVLFSFILVFVNTHLIAQFSVETEYRNRFEFRNGYRELVPDGSTPAGLIWQRSRIIVSYESEFFKLKFTPQDVRLWGDESQRSSTGVFGDAASFDLFEGYAMLKLGNLGWISVGRQELKYDEQRLLAARNWNNNGLTYDAILFKLQAFDWDIHFGSTWNNFSEASSDNFYSANRIKNLNFLWAHHSLGDIGSFSLLHMASGVTETDTTNTLHYKQTTGFYTTFKNDGLYVDGEAYYQFGKTSQGGDVRAFLIVMDAGFKTGSFVSGAGITYLSGNSMTGSQQVRENLFDIHYGARHRFYGYMDYFRNFSAHTNQGGLADFYFHMDYKFSKSVSIRNIAHYFQLAQTNLTTGEDKNLGYENDMIIKYKFNDWGNLEGGYVFYLPTKTLEAIQGVEDTGFQQFAYIQLTLTPTLFKQQ